jgi:two-component system NtrC family sensor kinase
MTGRTLRRWFDETASSRRGHAIAAVVVLFIALLGVSAFLWQARQDAIARTGTHAANLVQMLSEQARGEFRTTDLTLKSIAERLEEPSPPATDNAEFREYLRSLASDLPYVRALFVVSRSGFIVHDTDYPDTPRVSLVDRSYFTAHRDSADLGLFVGAPLISRSVERWFVPVARRFNGPDGSFGGVVVAAVEPRFIETTYRRLNLSGNDSVALFHANDTMIARAPAMPELYGRTWTGQQSLVEWRQAGAPESFTGMALGGREAVIAYRPVAGFPLAVATTLDLNNALAPWRSIVMLSLLALLFIAVLLALLWVVSERRRLEREMAQQNALVAQRLETVGQMTSSVAHDFNNILAAVASGITLIRKRGSSAVILDGIADAVERGTGLTAGLLDFARQRTFVRRPENPNQLLRSLEFILRRLLTRNIALTIRYGDSVGTCLVNRSQFDAAIINLVVNSAHALPQGGDIGITTGRVQTDADGELEAGEYVRITVADNGAGIAPEHLERVFEQFFTTKERGGTGLGLSQVRTFLREVGGEARIESTLGVGTRVDLYFPCVLQSDSEAVVSGAAIQTPPSSAAT